MLTSLYPRSSAWPAAGGASQPAVCDLFLCDLFLSHCCDPYVICSSKLVVVIVVVVLVVVQMAIVVKVVRQISRTDRGGKSGT